MDPPGFRFFFLVKFQDYLVKVAIVANPKRGFLVANPRHFKVYRFARYMLRTVRRTKRPVKGQAAKTTAGGKRNTVVVANWLKNILTDQDQFLNDRGPRFIVKTQTSGRIRLG